MLERQVLIWLSLLSLVAYFWPALLPGAFDPFAASKPILPYLIASTMFVVGGLLPRDEVRQVIRRWPTVLAGTALQYSVMPLLAYAMAHLFRLGPEATIGVIMVGCVPGAMASNILTLLARGNVSYSVSLTTSATLLSPIVVPFALVVALGARVELDPWQVCVNLLLTVVGPVLAGYFLSRSSNRTEALMRRSGPFVANLVILWIIAVVVGLNRARLAQVEGSMLAALAAINLLGYAFGYAGGWALRIPEAMRRALTIEVGMQNAGVGTMLALQLFPDRPAVAIPPALYTFGCMFTGAALARLWASRPPAACPTDR